LNEQYIFCWSSYPFQSVKCVIKLSFKYVLLWRIECRDPTVAEQVIVIHLLR